MAFPGLAALLLLLAGCSPATVDSPEPDSSQACTPTDEIPYDGLDQDCNGADLSDVDGDGFAAVIAGGEDCDDQDPEVRPDAAEVCNGIDDDCDGITDAQDQDIADAATWYADADADGFGDAGDSALECSQPEGFVEDDSDCDDTNAAVNPGADEICNQLDDDCDGYTDAQDGDVADANTWYPDADGDGYGDAATPRTTCDQPSGYVADSSDCDDGDAAVNPAATEICNGTDDDCDGYTDGQDDSLSDGSDWYQDADGDGYGDAPVTAHRCSQPSGYVADSSDCDDADAAVSPGASEICNELDDDCDGLTDEQDDSLSDGTDWCQDSDGDGYGDASVTDHGCSQPSGYVEDCSDCDDGDASVTTEGGSCSDGESCADILDAGLSIGDGTYTIDPDGAGSGVEPYEVYCDMSLDNGGWTLAAVGSDDGQTTWTWDDRNFWDTDTTTFGSTSATNQDFKSAALHELLFDDLLFVHQPSGIWAAYLGVGDGSQSFADFIGDLGGSVCYDGTDGWDMDTGTLTASGDLCSTQVFFNAYDNDGGSCGSHDDSYGPAWSATNNAGCPLDDVGHYGFGNNALYPSTECDASNAEPQFGAGFGGPLGENTGTHDAAENYIQLYVR